MTVPSSLVQRKCATLASTDSCFLEESPCYVPRYVLLDENFLREECTAIKALAQRYALTALFYLSEEMTRIDLM